MVSIRQELREEGLKVPMAKLCRWFGVLPRTVYYRSLNAPPKIRAELGRTVEGTDRTGAPVRLSRGSLATRHEQTLSSACSSSRVGRYASDRSAVASRIEALPSVAKVPDERWSTNLCRTGAGRGG